MTYYLTTAIAYTQKKPHIGNVYEAVLADCIARFQRLQGKDVYFLTGTDEHGQKIQKQAEEEGIPPQALVDRMAAEVKHQWDLMNVSYDQFIRTTDESHEKVVQKIFKRFYDQGDIYKGAYEGLYCLPCETFYTGTQSGENNTCPSCGAPLQSASEEAYFFKLGNYAERLMAHIQENPDFIQPESRKNEMVENFLKPGLQDLCVSRTSFTWGIPVEFAPGHVIYVWIDALSNYITALGYTPEGDSGELYKKYWPAQVQIIGKDILRFHTIYWPIMLMALDLPLPKTVLGHPWLLRGEDKMSKSKGNTLYADTLAEQFGTEALRYYLLREMPFAQDASITYEKLIGRINSDLANDLGNLLSRTVSMIEKYFGGTLIEARESAPLDDELKILTAGAGKQAAAYYEKFQTSNALAEVWKLIGRANKYIDETAPWILGKSEDSKPRLASVLYTLCEVLRGVSVFCQPAMPVSGAEIRKQLGLEAELSWERGQFWGEHTSYTVKKGDNLFPRLDAAEELAKIEAALPEPVTEEACLNVAPADLPPEITFDEFMKVDIRTGKVLACEKVPKSDKLLKFQIDLGYEQRQIVSGIAEFYQPDVLVDRRVLVVTNLAPRKIRGVDSQGMLLCGECADKTAKSGERVTLLDAPADLPLGAKVR